MGTSGCWRSGILAVAIVVSSCATQWTYGAEPRLLLDLAASTAEPEVYTRIEGSEGFGGVGVPVAGGADCDGDGQADFAYGSIQLSPQGRKFAGAVILVLGDGTIGGTVATEDASPRVLKFIGAHNFETTGAEIWMDDVTGDGVADLLIGRQNHTPEAARPGAGGLTVVEGGPKLRELAEGGGVVDLGAAPEDLTVTTFIGGASYDRLGIWMRTGDVTGDGIADIAVGADGVEAFSRTNVGSVWVIRGGSRLSQGGVVDLGALNPETWGTDIRWLRPLAANGDNQHFGATVTLADLDGNGRAELVAAVTLERAGATIRIPTGPAGQTVSQGGVPNGGFYIFWDDNFSGPWDGTAPLDADALPGSLTVVRGAPDNIRFGEELVGGADFDADGTADLFVGDLLGAGANGTRSGNGYVLFNVGALKGKQFRIDQRESSVRVSRFDGGIAGALAGDTAAVGDFDGDGIGDLMLGSPHDTPFGRKIAGSVHVFYGKRGGWPELINLAEGALPPASQLRVAHVAGARGTVGEDTGDTLCYSATAADVDGDGRDDLIFNEMLGNRAEPLTIDVGNVLVLSGTVLLPPPLEQIDSIRLKPGENPIWEIAFPTVPSATYTLERSGDLNSWLPQEMAIQGTGEIIVVEEPQIGGEAFFRIRRR